MKKQKLLPILLSLVLALSIPLSAYAQEYDPVDSQYINAYNEMLDDGVSAEQAMNYIRLDKIAKELEKNSQKIDLVEGKAQIINSSKTVSSISQDDEEFITNYINKEKDKKHINHEDKMKELDKLIEKYPDRSEYKIEFEDGSWVKVESTLERVNPISDDSVNTYGNITYPNEKFIKAVSIPSDGTYNHTYTLTESDSAHYAKNSLTMNYTCSANRTKTHINSAIGAQSSYGLIVISSSAKEITHSDVIVTGTTITTYAEAYNSVIFNFTGSVGFTLSGVFSFSVNAGASWTQYAITRLGVVSQKDYAGYYK